MQFNHIKITPEQLVTAARSYAGMKYDAFHTNDGLGADCAGFFLLVARKAGLLDAGYSLGFTPGDDGRERILAEILRDNFTEVPLSESQPGDLLRFRFDDSPGRHVAMKTSNKPAPYGSIIHSMSGRVTLGSGKVFEQRIDAWIHTFLFKAYRFNQWQELSGN